MVVNLQTFVTERDILHETGSGDLARQVTNISICTPPLPRKFPVIWYNAIARAVLTARARMRKH